MFYTYLWLREGGTPYYVGKGKGCRAYQSKDHCVRRPKHNSLIFVQYWESEEKAFEMEKWWIGFWGRKDIGTGILRNMTNGGDGPSGWIPSDETKAKIKEARKYQIFTEETRAKMSSSAKGKTKNEDWRSKIKQSNILALVLNPRSERWRAKQSAAQTGKKRSTWPVGKNHITFSKDNNKWRARDTDWKHLGYFNTKEEAEQAN